MKAGAGSAPYSDILRASIAEFLVCSFKFRAAAVLPETMQAALAIDDDTEVLSVRQFYAADALAADLMQIMNTYTLEIYSGNKLRMGAAMIGLPVVGLFRSEALPVVPTPGYAMRFQHGEALRAVLRREPDLKHSPPRLRPRDARGAGVQLQIIIEVRQQKSL